MITIKNSPRFASRRMGVQYSKNRLIALAVAALGAMGAAATATTASTTAAVSTKTTTAFFAWLSHADLELTVTHVETIEHGDGFLCLTLITHFHKGKAL